MEFEWDPRKSDDNARNRRFNFQYATLIFEGLIYERRDARREYGERRIIATGIAGGMFLTVVYVDRIDATGASIRRIISARRSNRNERKAYRSAISS